MNEFRHALLCLTSISNFGCPFNVFKSLPILLAFPRFRLNCLPDLSVLQCAFVSNLREAVEQLLNFSGNFLNLGSFPLNFLVFSTVKFKESRHNFAWLCLRSLGIFLCFLFLEDLLACFIQIDIRQHGLFFNALLRALLLLHHWCLAINNRITLR